MKENGKHKRKSKMEWKFPERRRETGKDEPVDEDKRNQEGKKEKEDKNKRRKNLKLEKQEEEEKQVIYKGSSRQKKVTIK